uniref:Uncharacterized protein n=1 Tax=Rhizophora mucronata TaxID=61149 RepID=A0A2P2PPW2_RHIMU
MMQPVWYNIRNGFACKLSFLKVQPWSPLR